MHRSFDDPDPWPAVIEHLARLFCPTAKAIHINHLNAGTFQYSRLDWPQATSMSWLLIRCFGKDTDTQLEMNPDMPVVILLNLVSEPRQLRKPEDERISTIIHFSETSLQPAALPADSIKQVT
jgi:hypothetical protein